MPRKSLFKMPGVLIVILAFSFLTAYGAEDNLLTLEKPSDTGAAWEDQAVEVNGIRARASHLNSDLKTQEVLNFYQAALEKEGWKLKDNFTQQNILAFTKEAEKGEGRENRFRYVAVRDNLFPPRDVYLVDSPKDLAFCRMLAKYNMQKGIMQSDASGRDLVDVPRYPVSKRMISVFMPEEGAVLMYQAEGIPKEIGRFYISQLKSQGWKLEENLGENLLARLAKISATGKDFDFAMMVFTKGDQTLTLSVAPLPVEGKPNKKYSVITMAKNIAEEIAYLGGE